MEGSNVPLQRRPNQSPRISHSIAGLLALHTHWAAEHLHAQSIGHLQECHVQIAEPALGLPTAAHPEVADPKVR